MTITLLGMTQPGRTYSSESYRYGFNGMEKDDEVKGGGNHYTTFFRQYDSRVGRWFSIDPAMRKYPGWSPYNFAFNNSINRIDPNGDDPPTLEEVIQKGKELNTFLKLMQANKITDENYIDKIVRGARSMIDPKTKQIAIKFRTLDETVLSLTHELTNLTHLDEFTKLQDDVSKGFITPEDYAIEVLNLEAEGIANKIFVAAELEIEYKGSQAIVDSFKKGELTKVQVLELVRSNIKNTIVKDTGEKAVDSYKKKGQEMRKNYLLLHPEMEIDSAETSK